MWKPKDGEYYYYPWFDDDDPYELVQWSGSYQDKMRYSYGLVCRTYKEAVEKANIMVTSIK